SPSPTLFPYTTLFRSGAAGDGVAGAGAGRAASPSARHRRRPDDAGAARRRALRADPAGAAGRAGARPVLGALRRRRGAAAGLRRSEEHTSELQSLAYL